MIPQSQPKKPKNSSKVNLIISAVVHTAIILALVYFAARQGFLGKTLQTITVTKVEEKKPEPEKPKEEPKPEPPKVEPPKVEQPKVTETKVAPPVVAPPVVAPAAVDLPSFDFAGGKTVVSENDPVQLYKGYLEYQLRSKWNRPEDMQDDKFVAEVQVGVNKQGQLDVLKWLKTSGNNRWDQTVKDVFRLVTSIDRRPPTNFPPVVTIRFDVDEQTEDLMMP